LVFAFAIRLSRSLVCGWTLPLSIKGSPHASSTAIAKRATAAFADCILCDPCYDIQVRIGRQAVSFALGVGVGVCLYLLLKHSPLFQTPMSNLPSQASANIRRQSHPTPSDQGPLLAQDAAPAGAPSEESVHAVTRRTATRRAWVQPKPHTVKIDEPAATKEVAQVSVSSAPPAPTTFKPMGYVEKAGGQLEAIILQENEVQVVHINDLIADRYRVTKITPDSVEAVDETLVQSPMAKPNGAETKELTAGVAKEPPTALEVVAQAQPGVVAVAAKSDYLADTQGRGLAPAVLAQAQPTTPSQTAREDRIAPPQGAEPGANSLGYVQEADGKIETVVADGDSVRLVPEASTVSVAQVAPGNSPEGASPAQGSPPPASTVASTWGANPESSVYPGGVSALPRASVIRKASYQIPVPAPGAADRSAPNRPVMGSVSEAARTADAASDATLSIFNEKPVGSSDRPPDTPVLMKPLGYVVKEDGEFAAILSDYDEVYIVRQGDRFAGRYRALSVSADAVEAVEDPPRQAHPPPFRAPPAIPDFLSASAQQGPFLVSDEYCLGCESYELGEVSSRVSDDPQKEAETPPPKNRKDAHVDVTPARGPRQRYTPILKKTGTSPDPGTFVFQTLGSVETQDGEMRAIVADGSQVYLVKQGETFADQYRATSVDSTLVLAVRVSPGQDVGNAQAEYGGRPASKRLYVSLHFPLSGLANVQALHEMVASGSPGSTDLGVNLLNSSLTGFELQSHFFMADSPNVRF